MTNLKRAFVAATLCCLVPSVAMAYRYQSGNPRWEYSSMPITFHATYVSTGDWDGRSKAKVEQIIKSAFGLWEAATCHFIVFKYGGTTTARAPDKDGKSVISWMSIIPGVK